MIEHLLGRCTTAAVMILLGSALSATEAKAAVIINNSFADSEAGGSGYEGQSFTIPSGTSFNNITFSWIAFTGGTPLATGDLFLLSQPYLGSPAGLSAATPGFLSHTTTISGSAYVFDPTISVFAGNVYWVYMGDDAALLGGGYDTAGSYAGGKPYESFGGGASNSNYITDNSIDFAFRLQGNAIPEPTTSVLTIISFCGMCLHRFRGRRSVAG